MRLLWGTVPPLLLNSDCTFIAGGAIHLPTRTHWRHHAAAAAHATAHLVYSPARFDGSGLGPVARLLLALLEDARVEALAIRELPGLARLWRPLHTATPESGESFDGLIARLARSLADPEYDDPNPWVRKGRALCFLDLGLNVPAICTPAELRTAATRLGHDIGQMRLPFNAKCCCPTPAYRDDHRWMWNADQLESTPPPAAVAATTPLADDDVPDLADSVTHHPEWDRLIGRLRPQWCRVVESRAAQAPKAEPDESTRSLSEQLGAPLRELERASAHACRTDHGEAFEPDALTDWALARRIRRAGDPRVYRGPRTGHARAAVCLLIDQSASTSAALRTGEKSTLHTAIQSATAIGLALRSRGVDLAVAAFDSNGRHAVSVRTVKTFDEPFDAAIVARLQALRPGRSTRLGAALRFATQRVAARQGVRRWVMVLSDGRPHDIDVHDRLYLIDDARRAVMAASRRGTRVACLVVAPDGIAEAVRIFGSRGAVGVHDLADLPDAMRRLLA